MSHEMEVPGNVVQLDASALSKAAIRLLRRMVDDHPDSTFLQVAISAGDATVIPAAVAVPLSEFVVEIDVAGRRFHIPFPKILDELFEETR